MSLHRNIGSTKPIYTNGGPTTDPVYYPIDPIIDPPKYTDPPIFIDPILIKPHPDPAEIVTKREPVPGQLYNARVTDGDNRGIKAAFFYLDIDGKQISVDYYTDDDGYFHFTVPDFNYQNTFLQVYSTDEYDNVVKTFADLCNTGIVVLHKKKKTSDLLLPISLAVGIFAVMKGGKKSVGTINFRDKKTLQTGGLILGGLAVAYFIFKYKPSEQQKDYLKAAANRLEQLSSDFGIVPSLSLAQFTQMASTIKDAVAGCGTDESSIYRVFEMLNNEADFWQLVVTYGIQKYPGCFDAGIFKRMVHYTLSESLAEDLLPEEIERLNQILFDAGIHVNL